MLFVGGAYFGYLTFGHVQTRVDGWLDPFSDPDDYYQIIQGAVRPRRAAASSAPGWGEGDPS